MSKFSGVVKTSIKDSLVYRFDMAITLITAPISILVFYSLWSAIYKYSGVDVIRGFTLIQLISYYVLTWVIGIFSYSDIEDAISHQVRSGGITKELLKPLNYLVSNFFITIGHRSFAMFIEIIPVFAIGFIFFNIRTSLTYLPFFLLSAIFAFILTYLLSALVGMTAFWLVQNRGIVKIKRVLINFLSGAVIPLTFFPLWFQKLSYFLPFQYLTFIPINIWLGKYTLIQTIQFLGLQLLWTAVFYMICFFVWKAAMKKVAAVGI